MKGKEAISLLANRINQPHVIEKYLDKAFRAGVASAQNGSDYKTELLAKWIAKARIEDDPLLDTLFSLDDAWNEVYQKHRIKDGFYEAQLKANAYVISQIMCVMCS